MIWHANQAAVPDPDMIYPGQVLKMTCAELAAAVRATADPPPAGKVWGKSYGDPNYCGDGDGDGWDVNCQSRGTGARAISAPAPAPAAAVATSPGTVGTAGMSAFEQCVIQRESGGNPRAVNPSSGAGGLFQFLPSTWASLGFSGLPENASVATQEAAFAKAYALDGVSPWRPYDGC